MFKKGNKKIKLSENDHEENSGDQNSVAFTTGNDVTPIIEDSKDVDAGASTSKEEDHDSEGDEEIFNMLDGIVNRKINSAEVLEIGVVYKLVDVYTMSVSGRLATVGGMKRDDDGQVTYIWLPAMLLRNMNTDEMLKELVAKLQTGISKKRYAYVLYKGKGTNLKNYGFHDISWFNRKH